MYKQINSYQMKSLKKILVALLLVTLGAGVADAKFRFGVKAGLNLNSLHLKDPGKNFESDNGTGWTAGLMTEFQVPVIGLCFDLSLMYTRMNADLLMEENNLDYIAPNKNFIEIPLNLKYKISLPVVGNIISPYIFTGPAFAFKLDKNTLNDFKTKTCQVAWNVGLGLQLVRHLQIGASYGFGINNIVSKIPVNINAQDVKSRNNYWTITAAYLF